MAYLTQGSTAISVTNFGARGDGVTLDTSSIQQAINSLQSKGLPGTVFLPRARYLTSGYLNITGNNITILGEPGSYIVTAPSGDYHKFNISGGSGISIRNLSIDAGRTTGQNFIYDGAINVYSATGFTFQNNYFAHSESIAVNLRGATKYVTIQDNIFEDYFVGIYTNSSDISGSATQFVTVDNNQFVRCATNVYATSSASVKLQNNGFEAPNQVVPGQSYGHRVVNNSIVSGGLLGIELWGYISDSVVANNVLDACDFGISIAAFSHDIVVDSNIINNSFYTAIEAADAANVVISNNVIQGATGVYYPYSGATQSQRRCYTQVGIISNSILTSNPLQTTIVGNIIKNCSDASIKTYASKSVNIVGNTIVNDALAAGTCFNIQNSNDILFSNNAMYNYSTGVYFVFIDGASVGCNNVVISNNQFNGIVSQWGILYYNNFSTGVNNNNILVENNNTVGVTYCGYGMVEGSTWPNRLLQRNNFGPTGVGYTISDYSIPAGSQPYTTSDIADGIQYYGHYSYTIPSGAGITGDGIWICAWSGGGGYTNNLRVKYQGFSDYGNNATSTEFFASMMPYQGPNLKHSLAAMPQGNYFSSQILQAKTISHDSSNATNSLWLKLQSVGTGIYTPLNLYYSAANSLITPYSTYTEPVDTQNNAKIFFNQANNENLMPKYSYGIALGNNTRIYSPSSGVMVLDAELISGIAAQWASGTNGNIYSLANGNVGIGTSGPLSGKLHVQGFSGNSTIAQFSSNNADVSSRIVGNHGTHLGGYVFGNESNAVLPYGYGFDYNGNPLVGALDGSDTVLFVDKTNSRIGVKVSNPNAALHVNGAVTLSGITTSTTANVGGATLPANPVGFVTINITGGNFKIPYYNI